MLALGVHLPNATHLKIREFDSWMLFALQTAAAAAFPILPVLYVLLVGSQHEVVQVDAVRTVALVAEDLSFGNRPLLRKFPHKTMHRYGYAFVGSPAVSS